MSASALDEMNQLTWFHRLPLGLSEPGQRVITPGVSGPKLGFSEEEYFSHFGLPKDLSGLSVLDIGCCDGLFAFECERRGASRILALDIKPQPDGSIGSTAAFKFAKKARKSKVEFRALTIYDLSPKVVGDFDLVLCFGVLYHLEHPLLGLEKVQSVTRHVALIETARFESAALAHESLWAFRPGFAEDPTNYFYPTPEGFRQGLLHVGFQHIEYVSSDDCRITARCLKHAESAKLIYKNEERRIGEFPTEPPPPPPAPVISELPPVISEPPPVISEPPPPRLRALLGGVVDKALSAVERKLGMSPPQSAVAGSSASFVVAAPQLDFDPTTLPWLDRPDADIDAYVRSLPSLPKEYDLRAQLYHFREQGFVVFKNAAPPALMDAYLADFDELLRRRREFSTMVTHEKLGNVAIKNLSPEDLAHPRYRVCDFHNNSFAGKQLALLPITVSFLSHVFRDRVVAMQSLTYLRSSEQSTHKDYAYVVSEIASHLAGCWIALEDVHPDAGPLAYYPGSHRIRPKFDFGNGLFLTPQSSRSPDEFSQYIVEQTALRGLSEQTFLPKKGDLVIWHAALAHRGMPVNDRALTRKSFVSHCSSLSAYPNDRRAPGPPRVYVLNGGMVYGNPRSPAEEDIFSAR